MHKKTKYLLLDIGLLVEELETALLALYLKLTKSIVAQIQCSEPQGIFLTVLGGQSG